MLTTMNTLAIILFSSVPAERDGSWDNFKVDYCPDPVAAHTYRKQGSFNVLLANSPGAAGWCLGPPAVFI